MVQREKKKRAEKLPNTGRQDEHIVRHVASLGDGTYIIEHPDGRLERRKSETDWARLDAMTDEEIEASIANDPDWSDDWNWSKAVLVIPPKKKAISIRVDEDVLDYFKKEGAGYQRRINAVLRSYMQQKRKKRA
ncbi:MAG: BrnA antitoxin family protein [Xanthobacteraceae bacterium]